jgi:hypothetical protein
MVVYDMQRECSVADCAGASLHPEHDNVQFLLFAIATLKLSPSQSLYSIFFASGIHSDDVNAITFLDDSCQVVVTGSDDTRIHIIDLRTVAAQVLLPLQAKP